jgi:cysteine desulfurase / selenocysteine lyase
VIYLDNAATSWPKPETVYREMDRFIRQQGANPGRAGFRMAVEAMRVVEEARVLLKSFFHVGDNGHIIFTLNCTDSLNIALKGILRSGDHVITSRLEHNSVSRPLNKLKESGVEYSRVDHDRDGCIDPKSVEESINDRTRMIVLTHASNVLGTILPIAEIGMIAKKRGVIFLLDASQTAGALPINLDELNVDVMACSGHKGLLGPPGTGLLILNSKLEIDSLREGGTGSVSEEPLQPLKYPDRLEAGTPNTMGIAGLKAGIEFLNHKGLAEIRRHEVSLLTYLLEGIGQIPGAVIYGPREATGRTGLLSFNLKGWDPQELAAVLETNFDICCRAGLHCAPWAHDFLGTMPGGSVRLGIGSFNTLEEMKITVDAISAMAGQQ